jgi:hypothetical protein
MRALAFIGLLIIAATSFAAERVVLFEEYTSVS